MGQQQTKNTILNAKVIIGLTKVPKYNKCTGGTNGTISNNDLSAGCVLYEVHTYYYQVFAPHKKRRKERDRIKNKQQCINETATPRTNHNNVLECIIRQGNLVTRPLGSIQLPILPPPTFQSSLIPVLTVACHPARYFLPALLLQRWLYSG